MKKKRHDKTNRADRIFKIQQSINRNGIVLAYDRERKYTGQFQADDALKALIGDDLKIYVTGHVLNDGKLKIQGKVASQPW
jgi:hypothetical protein